MAVNSDSGGTFLKSGVIMLKRAFYICALIAGLAGLGTSSARAVTVDVFAQANSSSGGTGALTGISLTFGQAFTVSAGLTDLWNAGPLPRWSNADGLIAPLVATGSDDSGQPAGTTIGSIFSLYTQDGLTAPYGSLVGQIGSGAFFLIGTNFSGTANATGQLSLYYWDSNNGDNTGSIAANISASAVPGPIIGAGLPGLVMALGGLIAWRRRRMAAA
jgi:hypothetical protein